MRENRHIFIIKGSIRGDSGRSYWVGRCGDIAIRVDDRFDRIYRNAPRNYPEEAGRRPTRESEKLVSLRVVCIHAYERSLSELGEGMTGSLVVEGNGAELLAPGWILEISDQDSPSDVSTERNFHHSGVAGDLDPRAEIY